MAEYIDPEWFHKAKHEARRVILDLRRELGDAYQGLSTLPADHPARLAAERAENFLIDTFPA